MNSMFGNDGDNEGGTVAIFLIDAAPEALELARKNAKLTRLYTKTSAFSRKNDVNQLTKLAS